MDFTKYSDESLINEITRREAQLSQAAGEQRIRIQRRINAAKAEQASRGGAKVPAKKAKAKAKK